MKVSSKGEYGIMAMVDLAQHQDSGPNKIRSIAEREDIPKKFLEQVLLDLKRADLVGSIRGKDGGYYLERSPDDISLLTILETLEENVEFVDTSRDRPRYLASFWQEKTSSLREILDVSLSDLVDLKEENEGEMMYHI